MFGRDKYHGSIIKYKYLTWIINTNTPSIIELLLLFSYKWCIFDIQNSRVVLLLIT